MFNEAELISALKEGSEAAFKQFYSSYSDKVYNTSLSILQHTEEAEDITQEVFVEVFRSVRNFRNESSLQTWVYRITVSKCFEHHKKQKAKKRFSFLTSLFSDDNSLLHDRPHFDHPGILAEKKEDSKILFYAISKLPEKQKTAYTLHKIENLSHKEVAEIMSTSTSAVESLIVRANDKLRALLSNHYNSSKN